MVDPTRLCIGTMNFGARTPAPEARRIVDFAFDRHLTFFDTANFYGDGESERILGETLKGRRDQAKIATKAGLLRRGGKSEGLSAARLVEALDESLRRLRTDWVDVFYLHAPDPSTPFENTLDGVQKLFDAQKIRSWGVSNFASWQILELFTLCDRRGMPRPAMSQVSYNLLIRQLEIEYFAFAQKHSIHTTVYNPLAGGLLARTNLTLDAIPPGSRFATNKMYPGRYWSAAFLELSGLYQTLAQDAGLSLVTLAYQWLLTRPGVNSVLVGPGSLGHLEAAVNASEQTLAPDLMKTIDRLHRDFVGTDATYAR